MGAAASKKLRPPPHSRWMSSESASAVRGPVAMTAKPSGSSVRSSLRMVTSGQLSRAWVASRENSSRSTASAPPAGTLDRSAQSVSKEPSRRISSFNNPAALSRRAAFRELEQISSANPALLWAGENFWGFISTSSTATPARAICHAASHPASPAPITVIFSIWPPSGLTPWASCPGRCIPRLRSRCACLSSSSASGFCRTPGIFPWWAGPS